MVQVGDATFLIDNIETNWGIETWQLIYNGKEWKIISALFSINDPQVMPDTAPRASATQISLSYSFITGSHKTVGLYLRADMSELKTDFQIIK